KTGEGFARRVGVQRAHRAVVAGVHGLQQVERLAAADFADDDPLGTHTQAVLDQIAHRYLARPFEVRRARFETHDVRLLQLQLRRVFAGDDALSRIDEGGQRIEQRRLARAGTAGDQHVTAAGADDLKDFRAGRGDRAELNEIAELQLVFFELTNGERRAIDGQRRHDDVDARTVRQARVADRRAFINAAADLAHDALADVHQLAVVAEADAGF